MPRTIGMHTYLLEEGPAVEYSCFYHAPSSQSLRQPGLQAPLACIHSDQRQVSLGCIGVHSQNLRVRGRLPPTGKENGMVDGVALHDDVRRQPPLGLAPDHLDAFGRGGDGRVEEQRVLPHVDQRHPRLDVGGGDECWTRHGRAGGGTEEWGKKE